MRVRFAPSPTGYLHVGGARTALYNWLLARGNGGEFLLRIEDTDRERSTPENVEVIYEGLRWLGLDWDEDPVSQTNRRARHDEAVQQLRDSDAVYEHEGATWLRTGEKDVVFDDVVYGENRTPVSGQKDFVVARSDGSPVYHLAVVVDDHDMGVTQVIRGVDHLANTWRHVLLQEALGFERPQYAHLPLLHGPDGKKLSKRYDAASLLWLRDAGYLREAVINYLALLGWGYDDTTTFFSVEELQQKFSLERVSKNPAVFDEAKLRWMNGHYLRELDVDDLKARLEELLGRDDIPRVAVEIAQEKMQTLADFWPLAGFLVERREIDPAAWDKVMKDGAVERLEKVRHVLARVEPFDAEQVEHALRGVVEETGVKPKEVFQPVRVALAGSTVSPGIFESVTALGRDETLTRIDDALARARSQS
ncbi:MAG TPA: glutamate--tRNA ligase family protein [Thermoleophilaceae bacterium]|jgi:glutamyl-tRNA synthetase|nr:glutamate--tRNA ligase family protein [Thermoleophilaceae bacterium]